ncbi:MAG: hypothetical protein AAGA60_21605 [Cyanobacteria bacterium P01_E01_bin.42]
MCIENLSGIYDSRRDCSYEHVLLSLRPLPEVSDPTLHLFFKRIDEFELDGDRVIILEGADQYQIQSIDGVKSYIIDKSLDPDSDRKFNMRSAPTYFQIDTENKLVKFVSCKQFNSIQDFKFTKTERRVCSHWVRTTEGTLHYNFKNSTDFDLKRWQETEKNLVDLISQWKVN